MMHTRTHTHTHTQTCEVTPTLAHQTLRSSNAT